MGFFAASSTEENTTEAQDLGIENFLPKTEQIITKSGSSTFEEICSSTKLLAFYFSKHDCAPC